MEQHTPEEIDRLKQSWRADPCWDIEDTDGFSAYYDELKAYHEQMREQWSGWSAAANPARNWPYNCANCTPTVGAKQPCATPHGAIRTAQSGLSSNRC